MRKDTGKFFKQGGRMHISGCYSDQLYSPATNKYSTYDWRSNTIVNSSRQLIAGLLKNDSSLKGILFLALGSGDVEWDMGVPSVNASITHLAAETARFPITPEQMIYLDEHNVPVRDPARGLEISVSLGPLQNKMELREFGLYGGTATGETASGFLINYVIHPLFVMEAGTILTRRIRLVLEDSLEQTWLLLFPHPFRELPVIHIQGISSQIAGMLTEKKIITIGDLASADPADVHSLAGRVNGLELRARARMIIRIAGDLKIPEALWPYTIKNICRELPSSLSKSTGVPQRQILLVQEMIFALLSVIDNKFIINFTLGKIIHGASKEEKDG